MADRVGILLREWRAARRLSQLDLALAADVSTRHLSYVETGKSRAGRELLTRLADALDLPLRERNALHIAAGYAPCYRETALDAPILDQVRRAIDCILQQQEPYPAFVLNRHWDVLTTNAAAERVNRFVLGGRLPKHGNLLRQIFDPEDLRPAIGNWTEVATELIRHLHQLIAAAPTDAVAWALLTELMTYEGVPNAWRRREPQAATTPLLTTVLRRGDQTLRFFSTLTTFGTPRDITLDELHVECCFPVDAATDALCRLLAPSPANL